MKDVMYAILGSVLVLFGIAVVAGSIYFGVTGEKGNSNAIGVLPGFLAGAAGIACVDAMKRKD